MQERSTKELEKELSACDEISDFLAQNQEHMQESSVSEQLRYYMEKRALSRSDVIAHSGLNDIYTHQILSGKRRPSRDKLLCLCFGLKLTAEEVQDLLRNCGYAVLYAKNRRDSIILFALYKELSLLKLNEKLYEEGEALLN